MAGPRNIASEIRKLLISGIPKIQIAAQLNCAKTTITYHAKRIDSGVIPRPTYNWAEINDYHHQGHTLSECREKFGFSNGAWGKAAKTNKILVNAENRQTPIDVLLTPGLNRSRSNIKRRLLDAGLIEKKCFFCGITDWQGKPLAFNLDHADGNKLNWTLENLRMVCPNCDSQQDTFAGKNVKRLREQKEISSRVI